MLYVNGDMLSGIMFSGIHHFRNNLAEPKSDLILRWVKLCYEVAYKLLFEIIHFYVSFPDNFTILSKIWKEAVIIYLDGINWAFFYINQRTVFAY